MSKIRTYFRYTWAIFAYTPASLSANNPQTIHQRREPIRYLSLPARQSMGIDIRRDGNPGMTEPLRHRNNIVPGLQRHRRMKMPQRTRRQTLQSNRRTITPQRLQNCPRRAVTTHPVREHQV